MFAGLQIGKKFLGEVKYVFGFNYATSSNGVLDSAKNKVEGKLIRRFGEPEELGKIRNKFFRNISRSVIAHAP